MADDKNDTNREPNPPQGEGTNVAPFAATGRGKPCPICGRPSVVEMRPFCSKRCADLDLNRWLGEVYRVPASGDDAKESSPENAEGPPKRP